MVKNINNNANNFRTQRDLMGRKTRSKVASLRNLFLRNSKTMLKATTGAPAQ